MALKDFIDGHYDLYEKAAGSSVLNFYGLGSIHFSGGSIEARYWAPAGYQAGARIPSTGWADIPIEPLMQRTPEIESTFKIWGGSIARVFPDGSGFVVPHTATYGIEYYWIRRP